MRKFFLAFLMTLTTFAAAQAAPVKIAALVNGDVISSQDMQNRIKAFLMTSRIPFNKQTRLMITQRVLNGAIDEKLKLQAAAKDGINITEKEVDAQVKEFAKNNQISAAQLPQILADSGVSMATLREQLKAELAWVRVVRKKYYAENNLTQKEINEMMDEAQTDLITPKYQVSEIFIRKRNAADISQLVDNLRQDPRFELYAMQFSESPSASNGGNLGWVNSGKLAPVLEQKLEKMEPDEISDPILVGDGYYILKLNQVFNPKEEKPQQPNEQEIRMLLENQKMEMLSKKLLQDLREKAIIEYRS